ncbi:MAG: hypothetical protein WD065_12640 [Planctomycetaceae bacterium]
MRTSAFSSWCLVWSMIHCAGSLLHAQVPDDWRVDKSLYPKAFGVLANDLLMHPANVDDWPIVIGAERQLFVDDELIASMDGIERRINPAKKHPANPLIVPDKPWEGSNVFFQFVLRDEETGKFRMWYSCSPAFTLPDGKRAPWMGCYAESDDGVHWEKPNLGLHEVEGSRENNVLISDGGFFGMMHTPEDPNPERLYKGMVLRFQNQPLEGYYLYTSPDGVHWTLERERRAVPSQQGYTLPTNGIGDTTFFRWDPRLQKYIGDVKFVFPGKMRVRGIMESDDLIHWTRPRMTLYPDALDDPKAQIYGHVGFNYESMWLGIVRVMHDDIVADSYKQTTVEMTSSRDGRHWSRVGDRTQIIPLGEPDEWDPHYHDPCTPPVLVGNELWIYYRSLPLWKDMHDKISRIGLATLRRDGFVSLDAGDTPGVVVTRPLTYSGSKLFVNAQVAEGGYLKAELRTIDGEPAGEYLLENATPIAGDVLAKQVNWRGEASIPSAEENSLRLVFELKNAKLYSFWVE